jgi:hypothetical protein
MTVSGMCLKHKQKVADTTAKCSANCLGSRSEINACVPQSDIEIQMMESLKEEMEERPGLETYNFEEFLLCTPSLAEKKLTIRASSLLFKGMMMVSD